MHFSQNIHVCVPAQTCMDDKHDVICDCSKYFKDTLSSTLNWYNVGSY